MLEFRSLPSSKVFPKRKKVDPPDSRKLDSLWSRSTLNTRQTGEDSWLEEKSFESSSGFSYRSKSTFSFNRDCKVNSVVEGVLSRWSCVMQAEDAIKYFAIAWDPHKECFIHSKDVELETKMKKIEKEVDQRHLAGIAFFKISDRRSMLGMERNIEDYCQQMESASRLVEGSVHISSVQSQSSHDAQADPSDCNHTARQPQLPYLRRPLKQKTIPHNLEFDYLGSDHEEPNVFYFSQKKSLNPARTGPLKYCLTCSRRWAPTTSVLQPYESIKNGSKTGSTDIAGGNLECRDTFLLQGVDECCAADEWKENSGSLDESMFSGGESSIIPDSGPRSPDAHWPIPADWTHTPGIIAESKKADLASHPLTGMLGYKRNVLRSQSSLSGTSRSWRRDVPAGSAPQGYPGWEGRRTAALDKSFQSNEFEIKKHHINICKFNGGTARPPGFMPGAASTAALQVLGKSRGVAVEIQGGGQRPLYLPAGGPTTWRAGLEAWRMPFTQPGGGGAAGRGFVADTFDDTIWAPLADAEAILRQRPRTLYELPKVSSLVAIRVHETKSRVGAEAVPSISAMDARGAVDVKLVVTPQENVGRSFRDASRHFERHGTHGLPMPTPEASMHPKD